jgi:oligopeptide/dipeptide ABC transporter ATP-binding protein
LLEVADLNVRFATPDGEVHAVKDLSFSIESEETLGIVGESGSGKSQSVMSLMGLLAGNGKATGRADFQGQDLLALPEAQLRAVRGKRISMIFQDPMTSLNPYLTIGAQMAHVIRAHESLSRKAARARCLQLLDAVKIPEGAARLDRYPHELSGGMRQRVMIAASLLLSPDLLIADEPTTALDVTVQAQILELMKELKRDFGTAIILITHDLGVVAGVADRVLVMHEGELKEQGPVDDIFYRPNDAYTKSLLKAVPRLDADRVERLASVGDEHDERESTPQALVAEIAATAGDSEPMLDVRNLRVHFPVLGEGWFAPRRAVKAVDGVDLQLAPGETLGVVGESGCGKSTLARAILRLVPVTTGSVTMLGHEVTAMSPSELRAVKRHLQVVFQDPLASLNPRMTVGDIVAEPLWTHRPDLKSKAVREQVREVLRRVGLSGRELNRYPHEFSGGQCQRIGIARALVLKPKLIICDEPVSALDVSIQAQIVNLLMDLREEFGLSLIFIAHDLAVVRHISHRVAVMYLGAIMEIASQKDLYEQPHHPYTRALISAVPIPDPVTERQRAREILSGDLPSPMNPPSGCRFRTRCRYAAAVCAERVPELRRYGRGWVACHRVEEIEPPQ